MTLEETAAILGCTIEQMKAQYARNAKAFREMHATAIRTRKNVNHYTADQLLDFAEIAERLSRGESA